MKMIGWFLLLTGEMAGQALEQSASGASALYHSAKQKGRIWVGVYLENV
jgi:hypothetical protein